MIMAYRDMAQTAISSMTGPLGGAQDKTATFNKGEDKQHENFRSGNVKWLQEQNALVNKALDRLEEERDEALQAVGKWEERRQEIQREYGKLQQQLVDTQEKCGISAAEIHKRDEQIRVLNAQNRSLSEMLDQEEATTKQRERQMEELSAEQGKLQKIADQYDRIKETGNQQLTGAYTEIAKYEEELRNSQNETEQLREAELNFLEQSKVDVDTLEKKLKEAKEKNVELLQQIQHNEVHEHRMQDALQRLRETLDELTVQKKGIKMQVEMDGDARDKWTQNKSEVERRKKMLENTVEALRQALRQAEDQNTRMVEENRSGADNFRQLGDKVYSLMDQLRQHQMDLKKQELLGIEKGKKIVALDKQSQALQTALQNEVDSKLAAEAEARSAAQMQALLQKKNRMLEEAHQLALRAQEKVEKRLQELKDKANALHTQNEYLQTRIDGNEEDKGALKYELRRGEDELRQATATNAQLVQQQQDVEDKVNELEAEKISLKAELDYIKREDMLDETGRTKPILIESESKLVDRLQINEFLFSAQQARNPVPMLVEKIGHILEMVHTAHTQADVYLQDLQRSNSMLTALRQKNMALYEKVQMCETWKMRALLKIAANEFDHRSEVKGHIKAKDHPHTLYLDGLQYSNRELQELYKIITNYMKQDMVKEIRLQDNSLDRSSVSHITALIDLCPYLTKIDLKRNRLDDDAVNEIHAFVERIPGVTSVLRDPVTGDIRAKSGVQMRMVVCLEDQSPPDPNEGPLSPTAALFGEEQGEDADQFLKSAAGVKSQTRLQGTENTGAASMGASKTLMVPQKGGVGAPKGLATSQSEGMLPRIPSARR